VRQVEDLPALPLAFALESGGVLFEAHDTPFPGLEFERSSTPPDESEAEMKCGRSTMLTRRTGCDGRS